VWTSKAYAHSTVESAGVECEGGERRIRFETSLDRVCEGNISLAYTVKKKPHHKMVAMTTPHARKSRNIMTNANRIALVGV
jgi:hypothetical protein